MLQLNATDRPDVLEAVEAFKKQVSAAVTDCGLKIGEIGEHALESLRFGGQVKVHWQLSAGSESTTLPGERGADYTGAPANAAAALKLARESVSDGQLVECSLELKNLLALAEQHKKGSSLPAKQGKSIFKKLTYFDVPQRCPLCGGAGKLAGSKCPSCEGSGLRLYRAVAKVSTTTAVEFVPSEPCDVRAEAFLKQFAALDPGLFREIAAPRYVADEEAGAGGFVLRYDFEPLTVHRLTLNVHTKQFECFFADDGHCLNPPPLLDYLLEGEFAVMEELTASIANPLFDRASILRHTTEEFRSYYFDTLDALPALKRPLIKIGRQLSQDAGAKSKTQSAVSQTEQGHDLLKELSATVKEENAGFISDAAAHKAAAALRVIAEHLTLNSSKFIWSVHLVLGAVMMCLAAADMSYTSNWYAQVIYSALLLALGGIALFFFALPFIPLSRKLTRRDNEALPKTLRRPEEWHDLQQCCMSAAKGGLTGLVCGMVAGNLSAYLGGPHLAFFSWLGALW
ncbi:MAG: hypothetical protein IJ228_09920 [Succinivibrio sp.]|nr:hypothetical protein [Succinivibrio sp.]